MRVRPLLLPILALSFGFTLAACSGAGDPPRVTTELECDTGGGQTRHARLTLTGAGGLQDHADQPELRRDQQRDRAHQPDRDVLTTDACREPSRHGVGLLRRPINPAGTEINIEVSPTSSRNPAWLCACRAHIPRGR